MDIKEALERLESFRDLGRDWDSYDGLPPDHTAIDKAKDLLNGLFVCPLNDGNIQITLGDEEVTLIITDQGGILISV